MRDPRSHRVELRSALIGAAAALLAALLGGVVAGIPVLISTNAQIAANSNEARASFLRDERKAAYADLLARSDAYRQSADVLVGWTPGSPQEQRSSSRDEWAKARNELLSSVNNVKIVASYEVSVLADRLIIARNEYDANISTLAVMAGNAPPNDSSAIDNVRSVVDERSKKYDELHNEYLRVARVDLGVDLPR